MKKTIILLTKSYKPGGSCVAGIDIETNEWIRLVTETEDRSGSIPNSALIYENGEIADIYDIVSVDVKFKAPTKIQPENWLCDLRVPWIKKESVM